MLKLTYIYQNLSTQIGCFESKKVLKSDVGAFTFIHAKDLKNYPRLNFKEKAIFEIHQFCVDSIKEKRLKHVF